MPAASRRGSSATSRSVLGVRCWMFGVRTSNARLTEAARPTGAGWIRSGIFRSLWPATHHARAKWPTLSPQRGLELLGKQLKEFAEGKGSLGAERAGASESLGRGENSPKAFSRFEPLQPQNAQVVDNQRGDLEVHGEAHLQNSDVNRGHEPDGGRTPNIQHRTPNTKCQRARASSLRCSVFDVGRSVFVWVAVHGKG